MSKEPELGQLVFGNPTFNFGTPEFADALIEYLLEEIKRVYWNKNQEQMENFYECNLNGVELRPYYWGDNEEEIKKPNLKFNGLEQEIRWYKYPGRGQSCIKNWNEKQWIEWFDKSLKIIRANETL
jgi:hypothetical protein